MATLNCILCESSDVVIIESIDARMLAKVYKERAKVNVAKFFPQSTIDLVFCKTCGLKFYAPQAIGDGEFYDKLQMYNAYFMEEKAEFAEAARWISVTDDILEIGCGSGNFTNFIKCKSYTGLEFSETAIDKARKNGLQVLKQDLHEHSILHPAKYDVVLYFQVLEHVENPGQFIKHSINCLKPGGKLIFAVPNEDSFINKAVNFYLNMPPHHASRYSSKVIKKIAALNNLSLIHIFYEPLNKNHKLFYAKTKIYTLLNKFLNVKQKSIDLSVGNKLLYSLANLLAYPLSPLIKRRDNIIGQSVLAVYEKH